MAVWAETNGFDGTAVFLYTHAEEERQHIASEALIKEIGSWQKGNTKDHALNTADVEALKGAIQNAARVGLPQVVVTFELSEEMVLLVTAHDRIDDQFKQLVIKDRLPTPPKERPT